MSNTTQDGSIACGFAVLAEPVNLDFRKAAVRMVFWVATDT